PTQPKELIDPELAAPLQAFVDATRGGLDFADAVGTRRMVQGMVAAVKAQVPPIPGVESVDREAPGRDGGPSVPVRLYRPAGTAGEPLPVLLWMHGGGWVLGDLELDDLFLTQLTKDVGCAVASVDYRL